MWLSFLKKSPEAQTATMGVNRPRVSDPPLTPEETRGNLSKLENELNAKMVCQAGKNQVFIRSLVTLNGPTPPRIALKCPLRRDIGQKPEVFYEHIRDVCCGDPNQCEAYRAFHKRKPTT